MIEAESSNINQNMLAARHRALNVPGQVNEHLVEEADEDGGENTARYLLPDGQRLLNDDQDQSSFGRVHDQQQFLSGPQQERLKTFTSNGVPVYQHDGQGQLEAIDPGSSLKKAQKSATSNQFEMYTETVQRNMFAEMQHMQNARASPEEGSQ